ncbi:hypothetical protein VTG60DRAFT_3864 [Thermothelomyces hinnuleus]
MGSATRITRGRCSGKSTPYGSTAEEKEIANISIDGTKFAYYQKTKRHDKTGKVPKEYKGHPAFEPKHLEGLLEHSPWDHEIKLKEGARLKFFKIYYTSKIQDEELKRYLEENL